MPPVSGHHFDIVGSLPQMMVAQKPEIIEQETEMRCGGKKIIMKRRMLWRWGHHGFPIYEVLEVRRRINAVGIRVSASNSILAVGSG